MSQADTRDFFTPELLGKIGQWEAQVCLFKTPEEIAITLRAHGIGVIDLDRHRHAIDERVYESALHRGQRWERFALAYMAPREPRPETWHEIIKAALPCDATEGDIF